MAVRPTSISRRLGMGAVGLVRSFVLAVLVLGVLVAGQPWAWCPASERSACACCCETGSGDFAELGPNVDRLERVPCCEAGTSATLPDVRAATTDRTAPSSLALAAVSEIPVPRPATSPGHARWDVRAVERPAGVDARAGPSTAIERCIALSRFHC